MMISSCKGRRNSCIAISTPAWMDVSAHAALKVREPPRDSHHTFLFFSTARRGFFDDVSRFQVFGIKRQAGLLASYVLYCTFASPVVCEYVVDAHRGFSRTWTLPNLAWLPLACEFSALMGRFHFSSTSFLFRSLRFRVVWRGKVSLVEGSVKIPRHVP